MCVWVLSWDKVEAQSFLILLTLPPIMLGGIWSSFGNPKYRPIWPTVRAIHNARKTESKDSVLLGVSWDTNPNVEVTQDDAKKILLGYWMPILVGGCAKAF